MRKGATTRQAIIERAAPVFNRLGYTGASLSDLMEATGLQKGGIYNHFESKEQLALEAVDYALGLVAAQHIAALQSAATAPEQLKAMIAGFRSIPIAGGCPLLNTAIDSDDGNPLLRAQARSTAVAWHSLIQAVLSKGVQQGELRGDTDTSQAATTIIAILEGALMLNRLHNDEMYLDQAEAHLNWYIDHILRAEGKIPAEGGQHGKKL